MAKPWAEVEQDPAYQALSEDDREAARNQYFEEVVAPQVETTDLEAARAQFDDDTQPTALKNLGKSLKSFGKALGKGSGAAAEALGAGVEASGRATLSEQPLTEEDVQTARRDAAEHGLKLSRATVGGRGFRPSSTVQPVTPPTEQEIQSEVERGSLAQTIAAQGVRNKIAEQQDYLRLTGQVNDPMARAAAKGVQIPAGKFLQDVGKSAVTSELYADPYHDQTPIEQRLKERPIETIFVEGAKQTPNFAISLAGGAFGSRLGISPYATAGGTSFALEKGDIFQEGKEFLVGKYNGEDNIPDTEWSKLNQLSNEHGAFNAALDALTPGSQVARAMVGKALVRRLLSKEGIKYVGKEWAKDLAKEIPTELAQEESTMLALEGTGKTFTPEEKMERRLAVVAGTILPVTAGSTLSSVSTIQQTAAQTPEQPDTGAVPAADVLGPQETGGIPAADVLGSQPQGPLARAATVAQQGLRALPAPTMVVSPEGVAATEAQQQSESARQAAMGLTPDVKSVVQKQAERDAAAKAKREEKSVTDIHALAASKNIPWDNDPNFMAFTQEVTGKRHLDDLNPADLKVLYDALDKRPAVKPAKEKRKETLRDAVVRMGGISADERMDITGDTKGNYNIPGVGYLFTPKGTSLDGMAEKLVGEGWFSNEDRQSGDATRKLAEMLKDEVSGVRQHYHPGDITAKMKAEFEQYYADQEEAERPDFEADPFFNPPPAHLELSGYNKADAKTKDLTALFAVGRQKMGSDAFDTMLESLAERNPDVDDDAFEVLVRQEIERHGKESKAQAAAARAQSRGDLAAPASVGGQRQEKAAAQPVTHTPRETPAREAGTATPAKAGVSVSGAGIKVGDRVTKIGDDLVGTVREITDHAEFGRRANVKWDNGAVSVLPVDEYRKDTSGKPAPEPTAISPKKIDTPVSKTDKPTKDYGKTNKVFTEDAAAKARERLKKKLNQLNAGLDPELMQDAITLAGYHVEAGARKFADFSKAMIADIGEAIRPYLKSLYLSVRNWPGMDNAGMETEAEIATQDKEPESVSLADLGYDEDGSEAQTDEAERAYNRVRRVKPKDLARVHVPELVDIAKAAGIEKPRSLRKQELVNAIIEWRDSQREARLPEVPANLPEPRLFGFDYVDSAFAYGVNFSDKLDPATVDKLNRIAQHYGGTVYKHGDLYEGGRTQEKGFLWGDGAKRGWEGLVDFVEHLTGKRPADSAREQASMTPRLMQYEKPEAAPAAKTAPVEPKKEDFADWDEYMAAHWAWVLEREKFEADEVLTLSEAEYKKFKDAYSADTISDKNTLRTAYKHGNRFLANSGGISGGTSGINYYHGYELVTRDQWKGDVFTASELRRQWDDDETKRADSRGQLVKWKGKEFVFAKKILVVPEATTSEAPKVTEEAKTGTPAVPGQTSDMFGGKTDTAQAIKDREIERQKKMAEAPPVESGEGDLFSGKARQTDIEDAAAQAATSPENNIPEPTESQREAGNYKKGHISLNGLDISIENPAGTRRRPEWPPLKHHYGYIKGTVGKDKDHIDVFLGPKAEDPAKPVFIVDQRNKNATFDEHKVMLGFDDEASARAGYLANYAKGWKGLGAITRMSMDEFKDWLQNGDTKKPAVNAVAGKEPQEGNQTGTKKAPSGVTPGTRWDDMSAADRTAVLSRAGWTTAKGGLNFIGKKLLNSEWKDIIPETQATITRFMVDAEKQASTLIPEESDATDRNANLEPDRQDAETADALGQADVRAEPEGVVEGGPGGIRGADEEGRPDDGGAGLSDREAAASGERGDFSPYSEPEQSGFAGLDAGIDDGERGRDSGFEGTPPESVGAEAVSATAETGSERLHKKLAQQKAQAVKVIPGDLDNIHQSLPYLLPEQRGDVLFAEQRFAKPDGYGVLFGNSAGTGKTYTGLGILKRLERQGKRNILVAVPTDKVMNDWIDSGKNLILDIKPLDGIKDHGKSGLTITTYANMANNMTLADREWDHVLMDEAHYLMQAQEGDETLALNTLRALTYHPRGVYARHRMLYREDWAKIDELEARKKANIKEMQKDDTTDARSEQLEAENNKIDEAIKPIMDKMMATRKVVAEDVAARQGAQRPRATFLSATPFAYEKTVDWAEGYLFDYGPEPESRGYNVPGAYESFMIQHFGYRMRYNKLTEPEAGVDRGIMQRAFNGFLKKSGTMSTRTLNVDKDYDRRFIMVESAIGNKIDDGLQWLWDNRRYHHLSEVVRDKFDHLTRRYLLEAIKAREVIPLIKAHLARGRKVVVFHDFKKGGGFNPFDLSHLLEDETHVNADGESVKVNVLVREFMEKRRDLVELPLKGLLSPIATLTKAFPDILLFNGDVPKAKRRKNAEAFNTDGSGKDLILVQSAAGKEGISLHDTTAKHPRALFNLGLPTQPTTAIQQEGRIYRVGQASDAMFRYLNTGTNWERWAFAHTIATRSSTAENLALGEQARALLDAFVQGFEESDAYPAGYEGEGTGGRERDRMANAVITVWDRAMTLYYGQQKKTARTKAAEGVDYFATPEPLGLKMVEWANIRENENVLEPSSGHGAIARWFPENTNNTAIEPSGDLSSRTKLVMPKGKVLQERFEDHHVVNKYDAIVMNPPFGTAGRTAIDHLALAANHLRDGGRIVALIPDGESTNKKFEKWFYGEETRQLKPLVTHPTLGEIYRGDKIKRSIGKPEEIVGHEGGFLYVKGEQGSKIPRSFQFAESNGIERTGKRTETYRPAESLYLVADIKLPAVTFERAATNVRARILIIDKAETKEWQPGPQITRDYSHSQSVKDFFDTIQDATIPPRRLPRVVEEQTTKPDIEKPQETTAGDIRLGEFKHSKTGATMYAATLTRRLDAEEYKRVNALAKKHGGYYSAYKQEGAIPGFLFKSEASRQLFLYDMRPLEVQEEKSGYTAKDVTWKTLHSAGRAARDTATGRGAAALPGHPITREEAERLDFIGTFIQHEGPDQTGEEGWYLDRSFGPDHRSANYHPGAPTTQEYTYNPTQRQLVGEIVTRGDQLALLREPESAYAPVFYSALTRAVEGVKQEKAPALHWKNLIKSQPGVKQDELDWTGLFEWLDEQRGTVTKPQIIDFLKANEIQIKEVVHGGTQGATADLMQQIEELKSKLRKVGSFDRNDFDVEFGPGVYDTFVLEKSLPDTDALGFGYSDTSSDYHFSNFEEEIVESYGQSVYDDLERANAVMLRLASYYDEHGITDDDGTKFNKYTLPGGKDYRELLLTLPQRMGGKEVVEIDGQWGVRQPDGTTIMGWRTEEAARSAFIGDPNADNFRSSHFKEPNILAHVRFKERTDAEGKRVLFIEEVQSDWAQQGRKKGFLSKVEVKIEHRPKEDAGWPWALVIDNHVIERHKTRELAEREAPDLKRRWKGGVPDAPFVTKTESWAMLAMRRMIRYAADNGFDRIAWTTGEQQADRYDLSKQIDGLLLQDGEGDMVDVQAFKNGSQVIDREIEESKLADVIGKDLAERYFKDRENADPHLRPVTYSGLDLKVGGEGMVAFYDQMLPSMVGKYVKKWGGKVGETEISVDARRNLPGDTSAIIEKSGDAEIMEKVHALDITQAMRDAAMAGQALFSPTTAYTPKDGLLTKATEAQKKLAREALADLSALSGDRRAKPRLLGSNIPAEFAEKGRISLLGHKAATPEDLAVLAQVYRDPRFETFRIFFMKGDTVVGQTGISSRLPGMTQVFVGKNKADVRGYLASIRASMEKTGADGYYLLHNHPSGTPTPSAADVAVTQDLARDLKPFAFKGHVVINENKYGQITYDASGTEIRTVVKPMVSDYSLRRRKPVKAHPVLGMEVKSPNMFAYVSKQIQVSDGYFVLIGNSNDGVRGIMEVPLDVLQNRLRALAVVRKFARDTGSMNVFAAGIPESEKELVRQTIKYNVLRDVIYTSGRYGLLDDVVDPSYVMGRQFNRAVRAEETGLAYGEEPEENRLLRPARKASMEQDASIFDHLLGGKFLFKAVGKLGEKTGVTNLLHRSYDAILEKSGEILPESVKGAAEKVKAGIVSNYGLDEAYQERKADMQAAEAAQARKTHRMIEMLANLSRAEARVAYYWMQEKPDTDTEREMMNRLPEASRQTLKDLKQLISDLGKEAVRLGQLTDDSYQRNNMAYLHRSYAKHVLADEGVIRRMLRSRALRIKGDQYKGRGIFEEVDMERLQNIAPDFWRRKLQKGQADAFLKGEKFIRFEKRDASGEVMEPLPGMTAKPLGKLRGVAYWPASEPVPARFGDWVNAGTWEVRGTKRDKLIMWRDLTKAERERLGELDEVRYAVAQTLQMMVHDIEMGRFFEWVGGQYAKKEPEGKVVEAKEGLRHAFGKGTWVRVPDTEIPGTRVKKYGALSGMYIPGPIWNDMRQIASARYEPWGRTYANVLRFWKRSKTAWTPGVHMNNVMANFIMADWHDIRSVDLYDALKVWINRNEDGYKQLFERFQDSGALGGMFVANDLMRSEINERLKELKSDLTGEAAGMEAGNMAKILQLVSLAIKPVKATGDAMTRAYQAEDEFFRLAVFLKAIRYGHSDRKAGSMARHSFLDYSINAPWVQALRHTGLPFISFFYRAFPMLLQTVKNKPWKVTKLMAFWSLLSALGYAMTGDDDEERQRKRMPEEKAGRVWGLVPKMIRMPWSYDGQPVFLDIRRWVPVGDIADLEMGHGWVPPPLVPSGPLVTLAEVMPFINKSLFTQKEVYKDTDTFGEASVKVMDHLFKSIMPNVPVPNPIGWMVADETGQMQTYAWSGIEKAIERKENQIGEVRSIGQAALNTVGVKVGTYPANNMLAAIQAGLKRNMESIDQDIARVGRNYARLDRPTDADKERRDKAIARQIQKKREAVKDARERMGQ